MFVLHLDHSWLSTSNKESLPSLLSTQALYFLPEEVLKTFFLVYYCASQENVPGDSKVQHQTCSILHLGLEYAIASKFCYNCHKKSVHILSHPVSRDRNTSIQLFLQTAWRQRSDLIASRSSALPSARPQGENRSLKTTRETLLPDFFSAAAARSLCKINKCYVTEAQGNESWRKRPFTASLPACPDGSNFY